MQVRIRSGGVVFLFLISRNIEIGPELKPFLISRTDDADITVRISWDWENVRIPETEPLGEDLICRYYGDDEIRYCVTRGGPKGPIACTSYTPDFRSVTCIINETPFLKPPQKLASILRMLPMRQIFLHFGVLFFHASQIAYCGKGILFAAPSGIGKTTQARLWQRYRGVDIICNDRTLIRKKDNVWHTFGYPVDGSEPVCSGEVNSLGAVVLLRHGSENKVERISAAKALPLLISQVVMDCWSSESRTKAMDLLFTLMEDIPVYLLTCTPDEQAVQTLENTLIFDKVIPNG